MKKYIAQMDRTMLNAMTEKDGKVNFILDGQSVVLKKGTHFWLDARDKMN